MASVAAPTGNGWAQETLMMAMTRVMTMVSDDDGGDKGEDDGILRLVGLRRSAVRNARAHIRNVGSHSRLQT